MKVVSIITGATASGKSKLALAIAEKRKDVEIISADAFQVYNGFDIGTAKPTKHEQTLVRHHLIDILEPTEGYTAGSFKADAEVAIDEIISRGKTPLIVGGTGLYIRALTDGLFETPFISKSIRASLIEEAEEMGSEHLYSKLVEVDKTYADKISKNDKVRIIRALEVYNALGIPFSEAHKRFHVEPKFRYDTSFISFERDDIYERINQRVDIMIADGFVDEVKNLLAKYPYGKCDIPAFRAIGYREIIAYLQGSSTLDEAVDKIKMFTRRFAKRQYTWFSSQKAVKFYTDSNDIYLKIVNE